MTFARYGAALAPAETALLRALCVFGEDVWPEDVDGAPFRGLELGVVPFPAAALDAVGAEAGVGDPAAGRARLAALGLLDVYTAKGSNAGVDGYAVNRFARPLVEALEPEERKTLAAVALLALEAAWTNADSGWPADARGVEAVRTALIAGAVEALQPTARAALDHLHDSLATRAGSEAALAIGDAAVARAADASAAPDLTLLRRLAEAAGRLGHGERRDALLRRGHESEGGDPNARAQLDAERAERLAQTGNPERALALLRSAAETFERLDDAREKAVTLGRIADVLQARGETDEALRILLDEQLPLYERLGDARGKAVTMGRIADVLQARGDLDEALRIRREEQLPVFERFGDIREKAVTLSKIADALQVRGALEEALRIRREDVLPVFERLGHARSIAVTMSRIADVLQARGELDEALRIYQSEVMPVFERLGAPREKAVTMGRIADVLRARGEIEEALRVFRAEVLPVFERLGDVRSMAVTMGRIADVLEDRGDLDEALRIRREEMLPVFERLGDARFMAETLQKIQAVQPEGSSQDTARKTLKRSTGVWLEQAHVVADIQIPARGYDEPAVPTPFSGEEPLELEKGVTADETERFLDPSFYYGHYAAGDIPDPGELIPDDVPLEEHESYTLEIAIRAETIGIDRNTKAPTGIKPSREGKETVAVYARVESRDEKVLSFEDGFLPIDWAHDKDSERAFFRFETHPAQRGHNLVDIDILIYSKELHLLEELTIRDIVVGGDSGGRHRYKHWPDKRPAALSPGDGEATVGLSLRIKGAPLGYSIEAILKVGPNRLNPIPMGRIIPAADIKALLIKVRDFWTGLVIGPLSTRDKVTKSTYEGYVAEMWRLGGSAWRCCSATTQMAVPRRWAAYPQSRSAARQPDLDHLPRRCTEFRLSLVDVAARPCRRRSRRSR